MAGSLIGPCHFRGEMGHLRLYCPAMAAAENRKWYPSQVERVKCADVQYSEVKCVCAEGVTRANKSICEKFDIKESAHAWPAQRVTAVHKDEGAVVDGDVKYGWNVLGLSVVTM